MKILFLFTLLALPVWAEDWNINGHYYYSVKVITIEPDAVTILDNDGGARISMVDMPADLQARFHYDPVAAKAAADQRLADEKAVADALAVQKQQDALARAQQTKDAVERQEQTHQAALAAQTIVATQVQQKESDDEQRRETVHLQGTVINTRPDGYLVGASVPTQADTGIPDGMYKGADGSWHSTAVSPNYDSQGMPWVQPATVFVVTASHAMVDGDRVNLYVFPVGTFAYTTVLGANATVRKYNELTIPYHSPAQANSFNPGSIDAPIH
jgi:hypothetical protein